MERKVEQVRFRNLAVPKQKRVAAYARVSIDKDAMRHSLAAQVSRYSDMIQNHPGWHYAGVYADYAQSGTKNNRDEFNRLLADCSAGKIDMIITKSISRFARNTVDSLTDVRKLKEHGTEVYFEKEGIYTFDSKGELLITIMSSLAQEESRSISENATWGQRKRFADMDVLQGRIERMIADQAASGESDFDSRYTALAEKYESLRNQYDKNKSLRAERARKRASLEAFLMEIQSADTLPITYSDRLWLSHIDHATVHSDGNIVFAFRNGAEITEWI